MIVTNIIGGLGNQMFQYAAGLALSLESQEPLEIAVDMFDDYKLHQGFELERVFGISTPRADSTTLHRLIGWRAEPLTRRLLAKFSVLDPLCGNSFRAERSWITADLFFSSATDTYLHGYWQSDLFFGSYSDRIRTSFVFKEEPISQNLDILAEISDVTSASVHIRRGDYLAPKNARIYHQCSTDYYLRSLDFLSEKLGVKKFFVFSDEPDWAASLFSNKGYACRIVSHNKGFDSYNDMRLMSSCNHHVIANSSFSWWAAWLNDKPDKIVIAPREWLNGESSSRIIPDDWLTF